jgi:hypothetical protein
MKRDFKKLIIYINDKIERNRAFFKSCPDDEESVPEVWFEGEEGEELRPRRSNVSVAG